MNCLEENIMEKYNLIKFSKFVSNALDEKLLGSK